MKKSQINLYILFLFVIFLLFISVPVLVFAAAGGGAITAGAGSASAGTDLETRIMSLADKRAELEALIKKAKLEEAASIKISNPAIIANAKAQIAQIDAEQERLIDLMNQDTQKWWWEKLVQQVMDNAAIAFKTAARSFVNTLAYDTATYLATGDKGQKPMF